MTFEEDTQWYVSLHDFGVSEDDHEASGASVV